MDISALTAEIKAVGIRMRPAVPPEKVGEIEARLGIKLPEDYVRFITQAGDGWEKQVVNRTIWQELQSVFSCGDPGLLREPFPYTGAWIWENRETNPLPGESGGEWDKRVDELLRPKSFGNIPLTRGNYGEKFHLILNGKCSGEIWRFTDVGIAPCSPRTTFSEWITAWIAGRRNFG